MQPERPPRPAATWVGPGCGTALVGGTNDTTSVAPSGGAGGGGTGTAARTVGGVRTSTTGSTWVRRSRGAGAGCARASARSRSDARRRAPGLGRSDGFGDSAAASTGTSTSGTPSRSGAPRRTRSRTTSSGPRPNGGRPVAAYVIVAAQPHQSAASRTAAPSMSSGER